MKRKNMIKTSCMPVQDRGCLQRAAAFNNQTRRVVKSRICVCADCVGQVVIHVAKSRFARAEHSSKWRGARFLMPHAEKIARGIQNVQVRDRPVTGAI